MGQENLFKCGRNISSNKYGRKISSSRDVIPVITKVEYYAGKISIFGARILHEANILQEKLAFLEPEYSSDLMGVVAESWFFS